VPSPIRPWRTALPVTIAALVVLGACSGQRTLRTDLAASPERGAGGVREQAEAGRPRVLFIRGTDGSAPAGGAPDPNALSDITNLGRSDMNNGFGRFAMLLADEGYDVAQLDETGTREAREKVDLGAAELNRYAVVIFGSNNATYDGADAQILRSYVRGGGGVLFMSDTNWGPDEKAAPQSDSDLLAAFGITMSQDNGQGADYTRNDFAKPDHPVLAGVTSFGSFGVSTCTRTATAPAGTERLVAARSPVHPIGGVERPATAEDAALLVFTDGSGRGACLFDRDQFFNPNLDKNSHERLGLNLVNWLAHR